MAAAIKKAYRVESDLIGGGSGIFDVKADEKLIFSKHQAGRFPEEQEVIDLLKPLAV